ncbi:hypothetical protein B0H67DRAFT_641007 [Lasiosphaeris hirsuta]|uniref:Major facilitator superfamily (MFS) profile domain-containing protein n=1 Tax=Lasiosphaeris hirsuta TaxID=260670 RepID=A0AA40AYQ6_9PEZI|nr:hypothetical protein B0H67DRAFT_641007 [Lasiosphaeris hirsuta]
MEFKLSTTYNFQLVAMVATLGGMLFGFRHPVHYIESFYNPSGLIQGAIGSALVAGSVVGSALAGPISDKIRGRDAIMFVCIFWLIGTSVQVSCQNYGQLIAGRVLNGLTVAITSSQVPVYLAEIAKAEKGGSLVIIQQLAIEFGILIMLGAIRKPAIQTLANIQAGGNTDDPLVIAGWEKIVTVMRAELEAGKGWRKFVKNGMWKRTMGAHHIDVPEGVGGNANIVISVTPGAPASTVITFSFPLIVVYALTLAPVFNFALGMFTPPAFVNITWKLFIIFGMLCMAAAAWFWVFYPETCGKTLEEIEVLISKNGPKPWKTKKGDSRLLARIEAVVATKNQEDPDVHIAPAVEKESAWSRGCSVVLG